MSSVVSGLFRTAFAPPRYLAPSFSGADLSASGVKIVHLVESPHGYILKNYVEEKLDSGAIVDGDIINHDAVVKILSTAAEKINVNAMNVALPESKSFIFETAVSGFSPSEWRVGIEQHLDELVPLPPQETAFDAIKVGCDEHGETRVAGIGFAQRIIDDTLSVFDSSRIKVCALEEETFAMARALLPIHDSSTVLIIDIGKTTTKLAIVADRIPRFSTTIGIGGHSLTLAVQKHFGVTETEARRVKVERGIVPSSGNEDYLAAMLSTVSAIRDEISIRLSYWQEKMSHTCAHEPVSHAILSGGNASIRGLPEYLEGSLRIPVATGNVFTNLASRNVWIPPIDYAESLAYATSIGLALYDHQLLC